jgi:hypothetical protein
VNAEEPDAAENPERTTALVAPVTSDVPTAASDAPNFTSNAAMNRVMSPPVIFDGSFDQVQARGRWNRDEDSWGDRDCPRKDGELVITDGGNGGHRERRRGIFSRRTALPAVVTRHWTSSPPLLARLGRSHRVPPHVRMRQGSRRPSASFCPRRRWSGQPSRRPSGVNPNLSAEVRARHPPAAHHVPRPSLVTALPRVGAEQRRSCCRPRQWLAPARSGCRPLGTPRLR